MSEASPFSQRFSVNFSDEILYSRIAVKPRRLNNLSMMGATEAGVQLRETLRAVVVPTKQMVAIVRQMIERAKAYCDHAYSDIVAVRTLIYGQVSTSIADSCHATCLTGLAGVGKSVVFDAFCRIFSTPESIDMPGHAQLELHACWRMTIRGRSGFSQLLLPHFRDSSPVSAARILSCAKSEAAAQGIALILPDEFQFISSGNANTMMANLLVRLAQIGPPVIYACNYSMLHALWRRPQQDRDRLLINPIVLYPEELDADWTATVNGFLEVCDEFELLGNEKDVELLHAYTYGIKRCLRSLLVLGYFQMRRDKKPRVTTGHLIAAYNSIEYASMREDVENLYKGAVAPSLLRKDLTCPFGSAKAFNTEGVMDTSLKQKNAADATHAAMLSMQTPEVRRLVAALDNQALPTAPQKPQPRRRPKSTEENLLGGAERFAAQRKKDN